MNATAAALAEVAEWASGVTLEQVPPRTLKTSRELIADTVAVMARGSSEEIPDRVFETLRAKGGSGGLVMRRGLPTIDPYGSMVANSVSGTWFELDAGHEQARTHAPIHVLPVLLASPELLPLTDLTLAFTIGVEVAYRLGRAVRPSDAVHPHGVWSTVGAAAAASRMAGLSSALTADSMRVAAHLMLATSARSVVDGATIRNALPGVAAQHASSAVAYASAGLSGLPDGVETITSSTLGSTLNAQTITAGLGDVFELEHSYMKVHACCHHLAAAVDACIRLRVKLAGARIQRVEVATYSRASNYSRISPPNQLAAMFSLPFVVSVALRDGAVTPESYLPASVGDRRRQELEERVVVRVDPQADRLYPEARAATVTAHLTTGARVQETVSQPLGTPANPLVSAALREKFTALASGVFGPSADDTWRRLMIPDVTRDIRSVLSDVN